MLEGLCKFNGIWAARKCIHSLNNMGLVGIFSLWFKQYLCLIWRWICNGHRQCRLKQSGIISSVSLTDTVQPVKGFRVGFTASGWSDLCLGEIYYAFLWLTSDARCTYCSDYILFIMSTLTFPPCHLRLSLYIVSRLLYFMHVQWNFLSAFMFKFCCVFTVIRLCSAKNPIIIWLSLFLHCREKYFAHSSAGSLHQQPCVLSVFPGGSLEKRLHFLYMFEWDQ